MDDKYKSLKEKAFSILKKNIKKGYSKGLNKEYFYISPDKVHYHQWFWDSCFHIIVMSKKYPECAKRELETLLSVQQEDGFIPHIIFWKRRFKDRFQRWWEKEVNENVSKYITTEVQPPVIGISLYRIYKSIEDIDFIIRNINKVEKFYNYLRDKRDPDNDGLVSIITPMESGMDLSPQYDIPLENPEHVPQTTKDKITKMLKEYKDWKWNLGKIFDSSIFDVEDVAYNTIYCMGLEALSELYLNINKQKSKEIGEWANLVKSRIIEKFWDDDEKIFFSLSHKNGKEHNIRVKTVSSLLPITLDIQDEYISNIINHLKNEKEFWSPYPITSVSMDEPSFGPLTNTRFIWRGTTWINTNWFISSGLKKHGFDNIYRSLKEKTRELIYNYGFCEYYDPTTGEPGKAMRDFGWSTLAVEMLNED
jgi:hypothetical protein